VHHRLDSDPDRLIHGQPEQVESCRAQGGHRAGSITPVTVSILMELGIADPVPALDAPAVPHQLQRGFWGGAQAAQKQWYGLERLAGASAAGRQLHDPAGANPGLGDELRGRFGAQRPGDVTAVANLVIRCHKRDPAFSLDLAMQRLLIGFDRQQEVGPLLLKMPKNGFCVCRASAWISTPPRTSSPRSCRRTARSWFSPVAWQDWLTATPRAAE